MPTLHQQLKPIVDHIGLDNVWRPVRDKENQLLFDGVGRYGDIIDNALDNIDFSGKTVVDLGCNLGYYSFYAAKKGARHVVGVDIDPHIIDGCHMLRDHYGTANAEFRQGNFLEDEFQETFDIVLMVDFIGKNVIRKEKLLPALDSIRGFSKSVILMSLHPEYEIQRVLGMTPEALAAVYSERFIREGRFHLIEFVKSFFEAEWEIRMPCHDRFRAQNFKHPLLLSRKDA